MSSRLAIIVLSVALLGLGETARAGVTRQVLWVDGDVSARQLDARSTGPLMLQATDPLHGKVRISAPTKSVVWLLSGHQWVLGLHGPGTWVMDSVSEEVQGEGRITRIALAHASLKRRALVPWIESGRQLEPEADIVPVSPLETALMTRRPVLRWKKRASILRVSLRLSWRDERGKEHPVEVWSGLTGNHHEVLRPLKPGVDYVWRLKVDKSADEETREETTTWFHVLSDEVISAVRRADATLSRLQLDYPDAVQALEVVRALIWEQHGMAREAKVAWDELTHQAGDVEALRLYRARLALRVMARPRQRDAEGSGAKLR